MEYTKKSEENSLKNTISEVTRRNIFDTLRVEHTNWSGRLSEVDFLSRLFDLDDVIAGDIARHRDHFNDWEDDWIFEDRRFGLIDATDENFLNFLCEMVHPVVRPDTGKAMDLVRLCNSFLAADGWEIVAKTYISNKPVFAPRRMVDNLGPSINKAKQIAVTLNADYLSQQITRMEASLDSDPELAIGTAKEFLETICKTILSEYRETIPKDVDLPQLVKLVREKLDILPDDIPDQVKGAAIIKKIVGSLAPITSGIAELRGLYGTGHGKRAKSKGLQSRHAKLAVGAATTIGVFFFETYQEKKKNLG
jgi:hypothetical protein